MKKNKFLLLLIALFSGLLLTSCTKPVDPKDDPTKDTWHDYVSDCKLDLSSTRARLNATVKTYVDGDTTHFIVDSNEFKDETFKVRYLAIDTPESTGKVQPYGKAASNYTKSTLSQATSIILEAAGESWEHDSTGTRYLAWVWYKTSTSPDYKLLNLELLQNGYTAAKNYTSYPYYSSYFSDAYTQALKYNLKCVGNEKDPDFWYDGAQEITLKELRLHSEKYKDTKVRFECTIGKISSASGYTAYVYDYDGEDDITYGFQVFLLYTLHAPFATPGNRVSCCGTCTYYETGHTYQVSDIQTSRMRPFADDSYTLNRYKVIKAFEKYEVGSIIETTTYNDLDEKYQNDTYLESYIEDPKYTEVSYLDFDGNNKVTINEEDPTTEVITSNEYSKSLVMMHTLVQASNLKVTSIYTTTNESSSSKGAMTIYCLDSNGHEIVIRTAVLRDASQKIVTSDMYEGKTITVRGIFDYYSNDDEQDPNGYQIKVFKTTDIIVLD